jgi:hypothetical protein
MGENQWKRLEIQGNPDIYVGNIGVNPLISGI